MRWCVRVSTQEARPTGFGPRAGLYRNSAKPDSAMANDADDEDEQDNVGDDDDVDDATTLLRSRNRRTILVKCESRVVHQYPKRPRERKRERVSDLYLHSVIAVALATRGSAKSWNTPTLRYSKNIQVLFGKKKTKIKKEKYVSARSKMIKFQHIRSVYSLRRRL